MCPRIVLNIGAQLDDEQELQGEIQINQDTVDPHPFHVLQEIALELERERRQEMLDLVFGPRVTTEANNQEAPLLNVGAQPHQEPELQGDQINQVVSPPPFHILVEIADRLERRQEEELLGAVFRPRVTTEANNQEAPLLNVGADEPLQEQELGNEIHQDAVDPHPVHALTENPDGQQNEEKELEGAKKQDDVEQEKEQGGQDSQEKDKV